MTKVLTFIIALFSISMLSAQTTPSYLPTYGLIGYWPFDGNANDESNNSNNGVITGASLTTDRWGNAGQAYQFDGIDDYINTGTSSETNGMSQLSISFWINPYSLGGQNSFADRMPLISKWKSSTNLANCAYNLICSGDSIQFAFTDGASFSGHQVPITFQDSVWSHIVCIFDAGQFSYYLNGSLENQQTLPITFIQATSRELKFGDWYYTDNPSYSTFEGKMDEIAIYNRPLSPCEVQNLYRSNLDTLISWQPSDLTVIASNDAQFVVAGQNGPLSYQWQTDLGFGFQDLTNAGQYSGVLSDTLTVALTTLANNNQLFRCIVTSGFCSDTSQVATLTVNESVGINEINSDITRIFPNPVSEEIKIIVPDIQIGAKFEIFSLEGNLVYSSFIRTKHSSFDMSLLSAGLYHLRLNGEESHHINFIKQK